jgi:hypothetical protein
VGSAKVSAALSRMKAGLVIRSCAFRSLNYAAQVHMDLKWITVWFATRCVEPKGTP